MKQTLALLAAMLLMLAPAFAGYGDDDLPNDKPTITPTPAATPAPRRIRVELAGHPLALKVAPIFKAPFCMVPLHALLEALGCKGAFSFDRRSGAVRAEGFNTVAEFTVGKGNLTVNGNASILDMPPFEHDGDVMVQIGKASEIMGVKMIWSKDNFTVSIPAVPTAVAVGVPTHVPPTLQIVTPPSGGRDLVLASVKTSTADVVGYASGPAAISSVRVRGEEAALAPLDSRDVVFKGDRAHAVKFTATVRVGLGRNDVPIEVVDVDGVRASQTVAMTREVTAVATTPTEPVAVKGRRFALLVGIGKYSNPDINALRFTLNDVAALRKTLTDPAIGGYAPDHVRVLSDDAGPDFAPTKVNMEIGMNWLAAMASQPEDTVFIYFSGHGTSDANGAYLITQETRPEALLSTALNIGDFNKMVNNIKAQKKIVVLDACHSGGMDVAARGADKMSSQLKDRLLAESERAVGDVRFLSCKDNELSFEDDAPGVRQGIFSYFLVKGMRGEADANGDGVVTFPELDQYVTAKVTEWAALKGRRQTPTSDGKRSGPIIMSVIKK